MAPANAEEGDHICVLIGCSVPVILRKKGFDWHFVGECFVFGFMDGEAMDSKNAPNFLIRETESEGIVIREFKGPVQRSVPGPYARPVRSFRLM